MADGAPVQTWPFSYSYDQMNLFEIGYNRASLDFFKYLY